MTAKRPNIVYILADDLGYGDVACLNPRGRIPTPNLDCLATQGMIFTDAHASSSVCSPSRYSILTGRYNWRSRLQAGVVSAYGPPLIAEGRLTVPALLGRHGYRSACIGKWHLGWDWPFEASACFQPRVGAPPPPLAEARLAWQAAFGKPVRGGPSDRGFDVSFGVDVPNWPPYAFIEDGRLTGMPSEFLPAGLIGHNQASTGGPAVAGWRLEDILPALTTRACRFIAGHAAAHNPFFLYLPLTAPHTPLAVNPPWRGRSGLNLYADFVMETDAAIGRVLEALDESGAAKNTLVIVTSDNGCAPYVGVGDLEAMGHFPSAHMRGYKADVWDGGHRVPCIARWPGQTPASTECRQTVCLNDLMATCADLLDVNLPEACGEDSVSMLPLLRGEDRVVREEVVHHSYHGKFAIRKGRWKLVLCPGSGGWTLPSSGPEPLRFAYTAAGQAAADDEATRLGFPPLQLYDLEADPGEQNNLQSRRPDIVEALTRRLNELVEAGRSTPGRALPNDVPVDLWKGRLSVEGTSA